MEVIMELCGVVMGLGIIAVFGIGIKQECLIMTYGEPFEEHIEYRRWTRASRIITGISLVACIPYIIGLFI